MKNNRFILGFLLAVSVIMTSCYKDLDLDKYRTAPKVVLNSAVSGDTVVMASVSRTSFFSDVEDTIVGINDAEVELYVNGEFRENMKWTENPNLDNGGIYISSYTPQVGDKIKIIANTSLGTAWAEDEMPEKTAIENIDISYRKYEDPNSTYYNIDGTITSGYLYEITYSVRFSDAPQINYYCIRIESNNNFQPVGTLDYSSDPVFLAQQSVLDGSTASKTIEGPGGRTFSDELINGKTYTMKIVETQNEKLLKWDDKLYRKIILYSLSEPYYKYLTDILNVDNNSINVNLTDFGFSEPKRHYNNINGGLGILGTVQDDWRMIDMITILQ